MTNIQMTNDKNNRMTNIQNPNVKTEKKCFLFLSFEHLTFDIRHLTFVIFKRAQVSVEYLIVLAALIIAVIWGVNRNLKGSIMGLFNASGDAIGNITKKN